MEKKIRWKKWFTMIEVLVVIMLVSTTFMGIITWVISTTNYLTSIKQRVTALNLAKEWVEIMYNIRNTNWRRWWNQKDATRLKKNPLIEEHEGNIREDEWIHEWRRIIKAATTWENKYFSLIKIGSTWSMANENELQRNPLKLKNEIYWESLLNWEYKMHFLSGQRYNNQDLDNFDGEEKVMWDYRRYIAIDGLYRKSNNKKITCTKANDTNEWITCWDDSAKELRFCSVVIYSRPKFWTVAICSIMTNFEE